MISFKPNAVRFWVSRRVAAAALLMMAFSAVSADTTEPIIGLWEQYDDQSGQLQTLVRITKAADGTFVGMIEKIIPAPGDDPDPKCDNCRDYRRGKSMLGMQIIEGLTHTLGNTYDQGHILDPDSGEEYRLKITVLENGTKLDVHGYLGISLFGRSQIWRRAS